MIPVAAIGAKALYLLFIWLISAAAASWLSERKGYGEKVGLTFGLILSAVGFLIVLLLPGRPNSKWKLEGPIPPRRGRGTTSRTPEPDNGEGTEPPDAPNPAT